MQFFKHYHNARRNELIKELINRYGAEGYARYWGLLEVLCEKFDGEKTEIAIHVDDLLPALFIKQSKKLSDFLESFDQLSVEISEKFGKSSVKVKNFQDNFYFFDAPILVDLQGKDFKFATKERRASDPKNKSKDKRVKIKELRIKNKEKNPTGPHEKLSDNFLNPHLAKVKIKTQEAWIATYKNPELVKTELMKAVTWLINSGQKRSDMGKYFSGWLSRSSSGQTNQNRKPTISEIAENQIANNPFREVV